MKTKFLIALSFVLLSAGSLHGADDPKLAALRAADDERVAALVAANRERLAVIFSDELRYAHSTGSVDTKASYTEAIASGKLKYFVYEYQARNFTFPADGIALMTGRVHVKTQSSSGAADSVLSFLAVWREEKGQWHFLAWQSAKLPPATQPAK